MPTSSSPFFVLLPGGWGQPHSFLSKPLLGTRDRTQDSIPWLAVATGVQDGAFTLVPRHGLDTARAARILQGAESHAHAQLAEVQWSVAEKSGLLIKKPSLLRALVMGRVADATPTLDHMDDLSSEQIASPSAMAAAATLNASEVMAVVPKRGWLLVAAGGPAQMPTVLRMTQSAQGVYGRAGEQALSPHVFFWSGGRLLGYAMTSGGSGSISLIPPDEDARPEAGWMM